MSPVQRNPVDGFPHRTASRQQREAFRVNTSVFISYLGAIQKGNEERKPRLHQVSLSATGIGLYTDRLYKPGQRLMFEFALPPQIDHALYAHVEVVYADRKTDGSVHIGLKFEWLSNADERRLRDYCLAEERAMLRKELDKIGY